jgi:hypothetical protein
MIDNILVSSVEVKLKLSILPDLMSTVPTDELLNTLQKTVHQCVNLLSLEGNITPSESRSGVFDFKWTPIEPITLDGYSHQIVFIHTLMTDIFRCWTSEAIAIKSAVAEMSLVQTDYLQTALMKDFSTTSLTDELEYIGWKSVLFKVVPTLYNHCGGVFDAKLSYYGPLYSWNWDKGWNDFDPVTYPFPVDGGLIHPTDDEQIKITFYIPKPKRCSNSILRLHNITSEEIQ